MLARLASEAPTEQIVTLSQLSRHQGLKLQHASPIIACCSSSRASRFLSYIGSQDVDLQVRSLVMRCICLILSTADRQSQSAIIQQLSTDTPQVLTECWRTVLSAAQCLLSSTDMASSKQSLLLAQDALELLALMLTLDVNVQRCNLINLIDQQSLRHVWSSESTSMMPSSSVSAQTPRSNSASFQQPSNLTPRIRAPRAASANHASGSQNSPISTRSLLASLCPFLTAAWLGPILNHDRTLSSLVNTLYASAWSCMHNLTSSSSILQSFSASPVVAAVTQSQFDFEASLWSMLLESQPLSALSTLQSIVGCAQNLIRHRRFRLMMIEEQQRPQSAISTNIVGLSAQSLDSWGAALRTALETTVLGDSTRLFNCLERSLPTPHSRSLPQQLISLLLQVPQLLTVAVESSEQVSDKWCLTQCAVIRLCFHVRQSFPSSHSYFFCASDSSRQRR